MAFHPKAQVGLLNKGLDPIATLKRAVSPTTPWDSVVDFCTHPSFCGQILYPRQRTLLKLMFLETENMTDYDLEVIEEWRQGFTRHRDVYGVQPDIWHRVEYLKARGYRRFPHIQMVLGRRASKGFMGGLLGAEQIAYLYSLDNFQAHYGIREGKECYLNVGATSQTVAMRQQFKDILQVVEGCKYLQEGISEAKDHILTIRTPADMRRIAEMASAGVHIEHQIASLRAVPLSASSVAGRGSTSFCNMFDEFAHMIYGTNSVKSGDDIYEDWQPNLGQFKQDALTYVASSPFTRVGKFHELYQHGRILMSSYRDESGVSDEAAETLKVANADADSPAELSAEPTFFIFQGPSWELYRDWERGPKLIQVRFKGAPENDLRDELQQRRRERNPEKFKVEREGQFADVMGQYLDPDKVSAMFRPPGWRPALESQSRGYLKRSYRIHCDPGRTGANFAMAIGHTEEVCDTCQWSPENSPDPHPRSCGGRVWPHVIYDLLHVWRPSDFPPDPETGRSTVDYVQVQEDIERILRAFPSTESISFDQWNSAGMIAYLRKEFSPKIRVREVTFTEKENQARCEKFKGALNLGWLHAYSDGFFSDGGSLLEMELKFLAEKNGKVVKQDVGPVTTKDLADAAMVVATDLLHEDLERYVAGKNLAVGAYGSSNVSELRTSASPDRVSPARRALEELTSSRRNIYRPGPAGGFGYRDMRNRRGR